MKGKFDDLSISQLVRVLQDEGFSSEWGEAIINAGANASDQEFRQLSDLLRSDDKNIRHNVAAVMAQISNPYAIRLLVENALEHQDEEVVKTVILALMPLRESAVDLLHEIMENSTGIVRVRAALILAEIGNADGIGTLLEAIDRAEEFGNEDLSPRILEALGSLGDPRAVVPLIGFLIGDNWLLRLVVAKALVKIGEPSVTALLDVAKNSQDGDARCRAIEALGQIGCTEAVAPLVELLHEHAGPVRNAIIDALGQIGDPVSVEALVEALSTGEPSGHFRASKALVNIGSPALAELGQLLMEHPEPEVRRIATAALGQIGDPNAVPLVIQALQDKNGLVRKAATDALGNLKDRRAVAALCQALEGENWFVVRGAADALAKIGDARAIGPLLNVLKDDRSEVRQQIVNALQQFCPTLSEFTFTSGAGARDASMDIVSQGDLYEQQIFDTLVGALDDPLIRTNIARILVCLKGDYVLQRLEAIVENGDHGAEEIREALAQAGGNV